MNLGVRRLLVEVFQQQSHLFGFGMGGGAAQAFQARLHAGCHLRTEMIPRVDDHPSGAQGGGGVDVAAQVGIDRLAHQWRVFGHVDGGGGVQAKADAVLFAQAADMPGAGGVDAGEGVGAAIELRVDDLHAMVCSPGDGVLQGEIFTGVDADAAGVQHDVPLFARRAKVLAVGLEGLYPFCRASSKDQ